MPSIKSHPFLPSKAWQQMRQREIDADLDYACTLMQKWPESWQIDDTDESYGQGLLEQLNPFVRHLVDTEQLSRSTLRRHLNNLWLLGGELISLINTYDEDRKRSPASLLDHYISAEGGPLSRHAQTPARLRQYDATCKKLFSFRSAPS
jgi:hypothetical protein